MKNSCNTITDLQREYKMKLNTGTYLLPDYI